MWDFPVGIIPYCFLIHRWFLMAHSERLAQMYLLKIRHPTFNSNAGAAWRQLFVLAMMPWMRKHRVFSEERESQAIEALALHKLEMEEDNKGLAERFGEDVQDLVSSAAPHVVSAGVGTGVQFVADKTVEAGRVLCGGAMPPSPAPSAEPADEDSFMIDA